ncbi:MAG: response regulator [Planctomycetaceae bacterium]|nr:response regulator [Planctomycetaceae bacterium]
MQKRPLQLLIIDDSDDDALLLVKDVKKAGYEVSFRRVDTPEKLEQALSAGSWDLAVCDYRMPGFGGAQALARIRSSHPGLPFIFVSGTLPPNSTEIISKAEGFVSKDDRGSLVPVLNRVLGGRST